MGKNRVDALPNHISVQRSDKILIKVYKILGTIRESRQKLAENIIEKEDALEKLVATL